MKVSELIGADLDYWVAKADNLPLCEDWNQGEYILIGTGKGDLQQFSPSTTWSHGGPIIEREHIELMPVHKGRWCAYFDNSTEFGKTALIAAMRVFVASKLGDEVPTVP